MAAPQHKIKKEKEAIRYLNLHFLHIYVTVPGGERV